MRIDSKKELNNVKVAVLDDDFGVVEAISLVLTREGFTVRGTTEIVDMINELRDESYDIFIVDYIMDGMHGDEVVKIVSEFDSTLYIIMITGHKDIAPPLETLLELNVEGFWEKSDNFYHLILQVYSAYKVKKQYKPILKGITIGERLKNIRQKRGIVQDIAADEMGMPRQQLSKYENNRGIPGTETTIKMAKYYNVSSDWILGIT